MSRQLRSSAAANSSANQKLCKLNPLVSLAASRSICCCLNALCALSLCSSLLTPRSHVEQLSERGEPNPRLNLVTNINGIHVGKPRLHSSLHTIQRTNYILRWTCLVLVNLILFYFKAYEDSVCTTSAFSYAEFIGDKNGKSTVYVNIFGSCMEAFNC